MRTVSFSQPQVQQTLSRDFVCFTTSTEGDPSAGASIRHRPQDPAGTCLRGNGQQNVQTLFLTPEGEIYHAASGYLSPEDLLAELEYARDLFVQLRQAPPDQRVQVVKTSHRQRLEQLKFSADEIDAGSPNVGMGMNFQMTLPSGGNFGTFLPGAAGEGKGATSPTFDPMESFARGQILSDHKFCIDHPLLTATAFERDPTPLVGTGKSFFMSNSSGTGGR